MKFLLLIIILGLSGSLIFSLWYFSPAQINARARHRRQIEREEHAAEQDEIRRMEAFNLDPNKENS